MVQDQTLSYNKYDKTVSLQQRIETQTEITDTCWIWRGYANGSKSNLRGKVSRKGRQVSVTRLVWELTYGSIPLGLNVLHTCDVTLCIRPSHLFLGTQQDNVDDMIAKGRQATGDRVSHLGEENGSHKLTNTDVRKIREAWRVNPFRGFCAKMAVEFNVSSVLISKVVRRRIWIHIT